MRVDDFFTGSGFLKRSRKSFSESFRNQINPGFLFQFP